ncbi:MAG: hypothetical protein HYV77_02050 [Candidatus Wildermuthbacteria bacterium]|nr:hypothetical protein [Candidatus Wildermuthbacteria bacterium]
MTKEFSEKGVSLILVLMVLAVLIAIGAGISRVLIGRLQIQQEVEKSVVALYAADTGVEAVLVNRNNPVNILETLLSNGASYTVTVTEGDLLGGGDLNCVGKYYCITSLGKYKGVQRAIEIRY